MSENTVRQWLKALAESVAERNLNRHMDLVSQRVYVYGLPGNKSVDYKGWRQRRKNEFSRGLLKSLSHNEIKIKTITLRRIGFQTTETLEAANGTRVIVNKDIMLEQEEDKNWRVVEEKINNWQTQREQQKDGG